MNIPKWSFPPIAYARGDQPFKFKYRVIMEHVWPEYELHVSENLIRRFDSDSLPDELKEAVATINAIPNPAERDYMGSTGFYINGHDERLDDVGWLTLIRTNDNKLRKFYTVIVQHNFIQSLYKNSGET